MARRWIPRFLALALVAAAVWWWRQQRAAPLGAAPVPPPEPAAAPLEPKTEPEPEPDTAAWRAPVDGACPEGYPVKVAKSGIFHEPGGRSYDRTVPDRCYATAAQAEADGYRRAKA